MKIKGLRVGLRLQREIEVRDMLAAIAQHARWRVDGKALVYRFENESYGRKVSPRRMLGTVEAIRGLGGIPILSTRREVDRAKLEHGFYFESFEGSGVREDMKVEDRRIRVDFEQV
jgi:hypothetical protein